MDDLLLVALVVVAVALALLRAAERRSEKRRVLGNVVVAVLALVVGTASVIQLYRVGDSGAQSFVGQRDCASERSHRKVTNLRTTSGAQRALASNESPGH